MQETLAELPVGYYTIYMDESAADGVENVGAGAIIYRGKTELEKIQTTAGCWTSSYRAEMTAMDSALAFLQEVAMDHAPREVRLCTDPQS